MQNDNTLFQHKGDWWLFHQKILTLFQHKGDWWLFQQKILYQPNKQP